jgi:hypothetical protein
MGPVVAHWWGSAEATLDGHSCSGTFGLSSYRASGEGGGSLHLRCDDGSVLGGAITARGDDPPSGDGGPPPRLTIALTDGYLFEP